MSRFAKTEKLLASLSGSHDMTAATERTGEAKALVLVQTKDDAGFWCNVAEAKTVRSAVVTGQYYAQEHRQRVRICVGPKRKVVREIEP